MSAKPWRCGGCFIGQVGFDQGAQFRRHRGPLAEPQREAADGLVQQHAESIRGPQAPRARRQQQGCRQGNVDIVGDDRVAAKLVDVQFERWLAFHAERRRIHEQPGARQGRGDIAPVDRPNTITELPGQRIGAFTRAIGKMDGAKSSLEQSKQYGARRATSADHQGLVLRPVPPRCGGIKIADEAFDVGVGGLQPAAIEPQCVRRAHGAGASIAMSQSESLLLVRESAVGTDITTCRQPGDERCKLLRFDGFDPIIAVDT